DLSKQDLVYKILELQAVNPASTPAESQEPLKIKDDSVFNKFKVKKSRNKKEENTAEETAPEATPEPIAEVKPVLKRGRKKKDETASEADVPRQEKEPKTESTAPVMEEGSGSEKANREPEDRSEEVVPEPDMDNRRTRFHN